MQSLQQGQVVWVEVADQSGRNAKCRPAVVLTATDEIQPGCQVAGAAVTTRYIAPLPAHYVLLPWHPSGNVVTRLKKKSFAVCDWVVAFSDGDIQAVGGLVPPHIMVQIMTSIDMLNAGEMS